MIVTNYNLRNQILSAAIRRILLHNYQALLGYNLLIWRYSSFFFLKVHYMDRLVFTWFFCSYVTILYVLRNAYRIYSVPFSFRGEDTGIISILLLLLLNVTRYNLIIKWNDSYFANSISSQTFAHMLQNRFQVFSFVSYGWQTDIAN